MNFHDVLIKTPINERYSFIRKNDITQTSKILEISYNTVSKAVKETNPKERVYETKIQKEHIMFIYAETVQHPTISGEKLAKKIFEFFGLSVSGRTVNLHRNQVKLKYREHIRSVIITDETAYKRFLFTKYHIENGTCWRNAAFSDEAWFLLGRSKKWVWVDKNNITKEMMTQTQNFPKKVLIWGSIGWNFKGPLKFFDKASKLKIILKISISIVHSLKMLIDAGALKTGYSKKTTPQIIDQQKLRLFYLN